MLRQLIVVFSLFAFSSVVSAAEALPIIPGLEGWGITTPAGSGRHVSPPESTVIEVTNLEDSGKGSFRAAVTATGPRMVVFNVGGTLLLKT
ncbi:MAG: hypothetical protein ABI614_20055, partial [Planctomycetota bacterium]